MSSLFIHRGILGLFHLFTSTLVAGWMSSAMSWSPDAQWLSYTVAPGSEPEDRARGWLFDTSRGRSNDGDPEGPSEPKVLSGAATYRIWTTHRDAGPSVLIEESAWPLTAPSWSPVGRSVAFGRFVPESMGPHQPIPRGRLEVVIQNALDRKDVVLTIPEFELDAEARADFPHRSAAWSQDGQYLAFPRPGRQPAILILRTDRRRMIQELDHALLPAWSPDGSRLAFLRDEGPSRSLQVVERHGQTFLAARPVVPMGPVLAAPYWSFDGRSIFAVVERSGTRSRELDLVRVFLETGEVMRVLPLLVPEVVRRGGAIRSVAIDFDRDEERCFFAVDLAGRDAELVWSVPRDRAIYKRLDPLDGSLRIGSLALSPDGHAMALRWGPPGALTLPAIYDFASARTALVIPDPSARRAWLGVLVGTARALLLAGLPPAVVEGRGADRPTLLPLPGETPADPPVRAGQVGMMRWNPRGRPGEVPADQTWYARLARLGRFGSALCDPPRPRNDTDDPDGDGLATAVEDRLFFGYLRGDFAAAAADLEALEPQITSPDQRLALLSLRAQVLWSLGATTRARGVVDYLLSTEGRPIRRVEDTPLGPVVTTDPDPRQTWVRYLAARTAEGAPPPSPALDNLPVEPLDPLLGSPFVPPEAPIFERGGGAGAIPFVPIPQGHEPRPIRQGIAQPARLEPPPQPLPVRPIDLPRRPSP
jgi:hypothetical protein